MLNWITIHRKRLTNAELQDIQRYMQILLGQTQGTPLVVPDHLRMRTFMKREDSLTEIPYSLATFLVKDADEYEPDLWFLLPSHIGPSLDQVLSRLVDEYGFTAIHRRAGIGRRTYLRLIRDTDSSYVPSKDIIIRLALAMELSLGEASVLLNRAGYELSSFNERDLILDYCFQRYLFDIYTVNDALRRLGHAMLSRR